MSQLGLVPLVVLGFSACSDQLQVVCTDIGCYSGLEIQVDPAPTTRFRVEAFAPGFSAVYTQECDNPASCTRIFLPEFTPDLVNIRIIAGGDTTFIEAARPEYTESRPNGPKCPPLCRTGHVTVVVPAG
jgi:hypothetical protein